MKKRLRSLSCSLFGLLLCPAFPALAETIDWNSASSPSLLQTDPIFSTADSLFPASLTGNRVTVSAPLAGNVFGGLSASAADVTGNQVLINSGADVGALVFGGYSAGGLVKGNSVTISGGAVSGSVLGGTNNVLNSGSGSSDVSATGNTVTMNGGTVYWVVAGDAESDSGTATATDNIVTINSGTVNNGVEGGFAYVDSGSGAATATGNTVTINGGTVYWVVAGDAESEGGTATATGNSVTISGGVVNDWVEGGYAWSSSGTATANSNTITISGGMVYAVEGGYAYSDSGTATATGNKVTISGGTVGGWVEGGEADSDSGAATATNNSVVISGGDVGWDVYGGYAYSDSGTAQATGNKVTISGGTVGWVYGGYADSFDGSTTATGNKVDISGGAVGNDVYGGYTWNYSGGAATATGNIVTISGAPDLAASTIYGGYTDGAPSASDAWTGNTLNLHSAGITVAGLQNFQYLNFYVPTSAVNGDTMLHVTGTASIDKSTVNVGIDGASSALVVGNKINLIDAATLTGTPANTTANGTGMQGVTLQYEFDIAADNAAGLLTATVTSAGASGQSESLTQGFLSGMGLLNQGADLIAGWGMAAAMDAANRPNAGYGLGVFGAAAVGTSRYETGSSVDVSGISLMAGVSKRINLQPGVVVVGAFFEYGNGSYDTYSSFHADGDLDHFGGGLIGRFDFAGSKTGHCYTEASLRVGTIDNDFGGLYDRRGIEAKYDASSTYYGIHLGTGYILNLTDKATLDTYARYFWTQQKGDTVRLTTGETVDFDNVNSHRMRIGTRFAYAANDSISPYVGVAYEHEFDGEARATTKGTSLKAPSFDGGSGVGELGLTFKPTTVPVSVDLGVQGYAGTREGVTGTLHLRYEF